MEAHATFRTRKLEVRQSRDSERDQGLVATCRISNQASSTCRICWSTCENDEKDGLVSPCKCRGSMKYCHLSCLKKWQRSVRRVKGRKAASKCEICHGDWCQDLELGRGFRLMDAVFGYPRILSLASISLCFLEHYVISLSMMNGLQLAASSMFCSARGATSQQYGFFAFLSGISILGGLFRCSGIHQVFHALSMPARITHKLLVAGFKALGSLSWSQMLRLAAMCHVIRK